MKKKQTGIVIAAAVGALFATSCFAADTTDNNAQASSAMMNSASASSAPSSMNDATANNAQPSSSMAAPMPNLANNSCKGKGGSNSCKGKDGKKKDTSSQDN